MAECGGSMVKAWNKWVDKWVPNLNAENSCYPGNILLRVSLSMLLCIDAKDFI